MPNRIIKESICTSDNLTQLDWGAAAFLSAPHRPV